METIGPPPYVRAGVADRESDIAEEDWMETSLRQADRVAVERLLAFDRGSGMLTGAGVIDRVAVLALQAGSVLTRPYGHRGAQARLQGDRYPRRGPRHHRQVE